MVYKKFVYKFVFYWIHYILIIPIIFLKNNSFYRKYTRQKCLTLCFHVFRKFGTQNTILQCKSRTWKHNHTSYFKTRVMRLYNQTKVFPVCWRKEGCMLLALLGTSWNITVNSLGTYYIGLLLNVKMNREE